MISLVLYTDGEGKNTREWKNILKKIGIKVDSKILVREEIRKNTKLVDAR